MLKLILSTLTSIVLFSSCNSSDLEEVTPILPNSGAYITKNVILISPNSLTCNSLQLNLVAGLLRMDNSLYFKPYDSLNAVSTFISSEAINIEVLIKNNIFCESRLIAGYSTPLTDNPVASVFPLPDLTFKKVKLLKNLKVIDSLTGSQKVLPAESFLYVRSDEIQIN